ncbi:MAG: hypothetical protein ACO3SO_02545 [Luteolibacter sp.]
MNSRSAQLIMTSQFPSPKQLTPLICCALLALGGSARAATIFTENFDGLTAPGGNFNGGPSGQATTTHDLVFGASLTGWSTSGAGTIHAVDTANTWPGPTANPQNWGVMIWQDNILTQVSVITGSNDLGVEYQINFLGAGAVYEIAGQVNNGTTDGLFIELLDSGGSVIDSFSQIVAQPAGVDDLGLTAYSFNYTGDGSGDIRFRVSGINAGGGRFQGTIDDLSLTIIPEPSVALLGGLSTFMLLRRRRSH